MISSGYVHFSDSSRLKALISGSFFLRIFKFLEKAADKPSISVGFDKYICLSVDALILTKNRETIKSKSTSFLAREKFAILINASYVIDAFVPSDFKLLANIVAMDLATNLSVSLLNSFFWSDLSELVNEAKLLFLSLELLKPGKINTSKRF